MRAASDDDETPVLIADDHRALFTAELDEGTAARLGRTIRLGLDPWRFYFFDPASGENLRAGRALATA